MKNAFLQLQELEMEEFRQNRQDAVRAKVEDRLRRTELIGNVLELFFPKMADTITVMMGGEAIEGQEDYTTINEKGIALSSGESPPIGPGARDEIIR